MVKVAQGVNIVHLFKLINKDPAAPQKSKPWKCQVGTEVTYWRTKKEASAYKPVFLIGPDWGV
jgi:hypothetical protein